MGSEDRVHRRSSRWQKLLDRLPVDPVETGVLAQVVFQVELLLLAGHQLDATETLVKGGRGHRLDEPSVKSAEGPGGEAESQQQQGRRLQRALDDIVHRVHPLILAPALGNGHQEVQVVVLGEYQGIGIFVNAEDVVDQRFVAARQVGRARLVVFAGHIFLVLPGRKQPRRNVVEPGVPPAELLSRLLARSGQRLFDEVIRAGGQVDG